ncbi:unnamed protein product, partial [Mesorhabditis belari]|uniref:Uncharacterized protein n=1 Tax=Mesorhabditis belari TaxID=2138241 RepID=A0AAF3ESV4_9BILA
MFPTSFYISKDTAISIACYSLTFLHFISQVIGDVVMGVEYYRGYQYIKDPDSGNGSGGSVKRGSLHVSIGLLIGSYAMVIAGILLYITTMVLTIIGFRRRIRLLSYAYLIYLSTQFLAWFDMGSSGLSMQINSFFWMGFGMYFSYLFLVLHYSGQFIIVVQLCLAYQNAYERERSINCVQCENGNVQLTTIPLTILIYLYVSSTAGLIMYLLSVAFTFIGFQRRLLSLCYVYPMYLVSFR